MKKYCFNLVCELYEAFVEEDWFIDVLIYDLAYDCHQIELIVNGNFNLDNLYDVKDELRFCGFKINNETQCTIKRGMNGIHLIKFKVIDREVID